MIQYNFGEDDIKMVENFIEVKNKGLYANGAQVTNLYNRVLGKNVGVTNCGSCVRARIQELENALNHYKAKIASESVQEADVDNIPQEENKTIVEAGNSLKSKKERRVKYGKHINEVSCA